MKNQQLNDILDYLECPISSPNLRYANRLIHAYIRKVPWESVSRIVKRQTTPKTEDCPRWPEEFWADAIQYGFGGTCFESSLAFYSLLTSLGYEGYLTVNDMGTSRACHAAIILLIDGRKYLVDITIPLHAAIQIDPEHQTRRATSFNNYVIRPLGKNRYEVARTHHPKKYIFTLIDIPASLEAYQKIVEKDYTSAGLFLRSVVMVKLIDDRAYRFFSDHKPYILESFNRTGKIEKFLEPMTLSKDLSGLFRMPADKISAALFTIENMGGLD